MELFSHVCEVGVDVVTCANPNTTTKAATHRPILNALFLTINTISEDVPFSK